MVKVNQASKTLKKLPEMKRKFDVGPNQNFEKQPLFKKTSKCKSKPNLVLRAPINAEKQNLLQSVDSNTEMSLSESISGPAVGPYPLVPLPPSDVSTAPLQADTSETDTTPFVDEHGLISFLPISCSSHPGKEKNKS